ncbi:DUF3107 domain-containing protein [Luteimicrobium subarcticum]|uniref:Uncharacterized protein DUF3107 n=1 Tax=Luteimicrobium subarcticum TaxID=620910 RepID=A0A2M8WUZ9_9MICO|nr:DUF3107 domain-containing protein [Luteimicrobium subarcticum]PJI94753.1 uncharacterized protein DUF3107 [Luteimicrobium subarcticum]
MEVTIGVKHLPRELVIETEQTAEEVAKTVSKALQGGSTLELQDSRGRRYVVPAESVGYVEIGTEETRRVGFGTL